MEPHQLDNLYKKYGFNRIITPKDYQVRAYSLRTGYFLNADIVNFGSVEDAEKAKRNLEENGFACTIRNYKTIEEANKLLFDGFFATESHKKRLGLEYKKFQEKSSKAIHGSYEYISARFTSSKELETPQIEIIKYISELLSKDGPILIILEAAAGYGKTCTSFEVLNSLLSQDTGKIPIMTEFSLNRQAKIFKYVLLDEIDRNFSNLNSDLVKEQIVAGKTPLILDGFDELLSKGDLAPESFSDVEPMLETIGELLQDQAKILLTTRRTAIFSDYDFEQWQDRRGKEFNIFRVRLDLPSIQDWLGDEKTNLISQKSPEIIPLLNPVLLSYLKSKKIYEFSALCQNPNEISLAYFNSLLEREQERQDLAINVQDQTEIFYRLVTDMIKNGYFSDDREYIQLIISESAVEILEQARLVYKRENRPTIEELSAKLANHALLDRVYGDEQRVGFINEFVLGKLIADVLCLGRIKLTEAKDPEAFLEIATDSYQVEISSQKEKLWTACESIIDILDATKQLVYESRLLGCISKSYKNFVLSNTNIRRTVIKSTADLSGLTFLACEFVECDFDFDVFKNTVFVNCKFVKCTYRFNKLHSNLIFSECKGDQNFTEFQENYFKAKQNEFPTDFDNIDYQVLTFFVPDWRKIPIKTKNIQEIYRLASKQNREIIISSIEKLRRIGILRLKGEQVVFNIEDQLQIDTIRSQMEKMNAKG